MTYATTRVEAGRDESSERVRPDRERQRGSASITPLLAIAVEHGRAEHDAVEREQDRDERCDHPRRHPQVRAVAPARSQSATARRSRRERSTRCCSSWLVVRVTGRSPFSVGTSAFPTRPGSNSASGSATTCGSNPPRSGSGASAGMATATVGTPRSTPTTSAVPTSEAAESRPGQTSARSDGPSRTSRVSSAAVSSGTARQERLMRSRLPCRRRGGGTRRRGSFVCVRAQLVERAFRARRGPSRARRRDRTPARPRP